jgi:uncharacterized protein with ParB-like and HNH nuclease domain
MEKVIVKTEEHDIRFIPLRDIIGKSFRVKDYQRGYKWGEKEILELLNDVYEHDVRNGKYCLQPIIVKENNEDGKIITELIDGQQRITSIYLILVFLKNTNEGLFDISYETRVESKEFLSTQISALNQFAIKNLPWEDFLKIEKFGKYDNVDVYHFYKVYNEIYNWFQNKKEPDFKRDFYGKILDTVHVIWYDIDKTKNNQNVSIAEEVFLNLNAGKIPLASSELIKALFILECQNNNSKEIANLKASELALEWDQIENKLHDDSFWFFICDNDKYNSTATRIDFILDIVNKRDIKKDDDLFSYRAYERRFKEKSDLNWIEVKNTYNKLTEWYENKEIYHFVGFLIVSRIKSLLEIIEKSIGISKSAFKEELIVWIKTEFARKKKDENNTEYSIYNLEKLSYDESRKECEKALLFINILYYVNNLSNNKFPFELYKTETWSVEHINPQNPREFENVSIFKEWLQVNKTYFQKSTENPIIIQLIDQVSEYFSKIEGDDKRKLTDLKFDKTKMVAIDNLVEAISTDLNLHGISNLALLDKNSNSTLSNKSFLEKRRLILLFDQDRNNFNSERLEKKVFVPVCTRNVFAKIYSDTESVSDSFFGKSDMDSYLIFIESQLNSYYSNQFM